MKPKYKSTKFWLSVAAALASLGTGMLGYFSDDTALAITGIVCTAIAVGIYNYCEAKIDAANVASNTTNINATTTSKELVASILTGTTETAKEMINNGESKTTSSE